MISVVVADDLPLVRNGIRSILEAEADIAVVAEAEHGLRAAELAARHDADVVLMDLEMPAHDGLAGLHRIREQRLRAAVLMLTLYDLDDHVAGALRSGADGYLLKTSPPEEITAAVRDAYAGRLVFSRPVGERLVDAYLQGSTAPAPSARHLVERLSDRELEVWHALSEGLSNAEISARLHLSEATVKTYVTRLLTKLEVRDRVQAVVLGFQSGLHQAAVPRPRPSSQG
ncbi:response regulator transcription factor [Nocardioides sp. JQ2195]|uniref:response regulator n=1 Tax=Nocardioides sp. JQ2195 TaxID=2592334 RepID=UPI00143E10EC|nr:response regulator transcription factor [Nocardioides sp. JQ2195]QIX27028.1 response regulator transcription factor [Nocardioides sp. JQ2195]